MPFDFAAPPRSLESMSTRLPLVACLGFCLINLDATVVNVALPTLAVRLPAGLVGLQWVVDGYTVSFAALMLSAGVLSDRIGATRAFALGVSVFTAASVACGLAPGLATLVCARVAQGVGASVMLPASLALVRQSLPDPVRRARGIAMWAAGGGAAVSSGPVLGGLLTGALGWRAVFFVNVPIGLLVLLGLAGTLRPSRSSGAAAGLDVPSQLAAVLAMAAVTVAAVEAGRSSADGGTASAAALAAGVVALFAGAGFVARERRVARPSVPMPEFRSATVRSATATGFALNFGYFGAVFVLTLHFQRAMAATPEQAGLMFLPMSGLIIVSNLMAGRMVSRLGARLPLVAGQLMEAGGFLGGWLTGAGPVSLVAVGLGAGLASPPMMTAVLESVPPERAGTASGVLNAVRQLGGALGVAILGGVFSRSANEAEGLRLSMLLAGLCLLATAVASARFVAGPERRRAPAGLSGPERPQ
jgi:DHA2 family methylenomycin A resistance protein-like MFS transporter